MDDKTEEDKIRFHGFTGQGSFPGEVQSKVARGTYNHDDLPQGAFAKRRHRLDCTTKTEFQPMGCVVDPQSAITKERVRVGQRMTHCRGLESAYLNIDRRSGAEDFRNEWTLRWGAREPVDKRSS